MNEAFTKVNKDLTERIKELYCLYNILNVSSDLRKPREILLQEIAEIMVDSWQYPEITKVEIQFDGKVYRTKNKGKIYSSQTVPIVIQNINRGLLKVSYLKQMPDKYEGPFLKEERMLINAISEHIRIIIKNKELFNEKQNLLLKLRHTDKLATIGQLSAGIAHELNEPLANILGFSELLNKRTGLDDDSKDLSNEIIQSVLYAREITTKLLLFSRKVPTQKEELISINDILENELLFLQSRCKRENISLKYKLKKNIPKIKIEKSLVVQIFTNFIVNAIQAINHDHGHIIITTSYDNKNIYFTIEDNGVGIKKEHKKNIFEPFFTTKEEDKGTGLGLSVVYGIISSMKGEITFDSRESEYTTFKIKLPLKQKR